MSQFELVDDYLTNRMDGAAKSEFEQRMETDPQLKAEVNMQKSIIEGVKHARVTELKAMLNNVPIGGGATSIVTGKIIIATISAGIIGTALYFGLRTNPATETSVQTEAPATEESITATPAEEKLSSVDEKATAIESTTNSEESKTDVAQEKEKTSSVRKMTKPKVATPKVDVMDLTEDMNNSKSIDSEATSPVNKPNVSAPSIEVELDKSNTTYPFHYQFKDSKLVLYGPFDASLYEIIEINGGTHAVFLYYKDSYYNLDKNQGTIVPLIMIRDLELLQKLKKYRNKN